MDPKIIGDALTLIERATCRMPKHAWVVVVSWRQIDKASFTASLPHNLVGLFSRNETVGDVIAKKRSPWRDRTLLGDKESHVVSAADLGGKRLADVRILEFLRKSGHVIENGDHTACKHTTVGITDRACTELQIRFHDIRDVLTAIVLQYRKYVVDIGNCHLRRNIAILSQNLLLL